MKLILNLIVLSLFSSSALAFSPIIRPYQSVRASAMGNVRYTTGLYEENFFANPARMTDNPINRIQLPKFSFEGGSGTLGSIKDFMTKKGLKSMSGAVGKPVSARFQFLLPAIYKNRFPTPEWTLAIGLPMSAQLVGQFSQAGIISPTTIISGGPAFTIARRLLDEERLSVGITTHLEYRATSGDAVSLLDFLEKKLDTTLRGGSGLGLDFDLGTTFRPHWGLGGFDYQLAFAINNLMGGSYNNIGGQIEHWANDPIPSPRSFSLGVSAEKEDFWFFRSFVMALEFTDIGNNKNGSFFRTIHLGAEALWKKLALRAGMNQGYLCGGFGFDFKVFNFNLSTYGEEMGLNAGSLEDRRYSLDFGFQI